MNLTSKVHSGATDFFSEDRLVDTTELRYAEISVRTHPSVISVLRDRLMESFTEFDIRVDTGPMQVCMALEEALANAFYHGTLGLDSSLKEDGTSRFMELAKERCQLAPWKDRLVRVTELATPYGIWITINDDGSGFNVEKALERMEHQTDLLASGRGLVMMKAFTDELLFNETGTEVTLVIYSNRNGDVEELLREHARSRSRRTGNSTLA